MQSFKDNRGHVWTIDVNVASIKRVRQMLDVDLLDIMGGEVLDRLFSDAVVLCDVIYALVKPEADAQKVTDEDFGQAMGGDAIDKATTALLEGVADFFPQARRELLTKAIGKLRSLESKALEVAGLKLDSPELESRLQQMIVADSSSNSPESPELIPAP